MKQRICLGKIVAAHGVKGLVKIMPFGDNVQLLNNTLYVSENKSETLSVALKNPIGKYILADIEGIVDRDSAEQLRGTELYIERKQLPEIHDENSFYIEDLIGLKALDEESAEIGKVIAVQNFGAGDLLEIQPLKGEVYYIPFTNDHVPEINLKTASITIIPLEVSE